MDIASEAIEGKGLAGWEDDRLYFVSVLAATSVRKSNNAHFTDVFGQHSVVTAWKFTRVPSAVIKCNAFGLVMAFMGKGMPIRTGSLTRCIPAVSFTVIGQEISLIFIPVNHRLMQVISCQYVPRPLPGRSFLSTFSRDLTKPLWIYFLCVPGMGMKL